MSQFIIILALIGCVCAAPATPETEDETTTTAAVIQILKSESDQSEDGSYTFLYESGDGSSRKEEAVISNKGTDEEAIKVSGEYKYTDSDGKEVVVSYTADENGFVPVGTSIAQEISDTASAAKDLPKNGEDLPKYEKDLPKYEKDSPKYEEDLSKYREDVPRNVEDLPKNGKFLSKNGKDFSKNAKDLSKSEEREDV